MTAVKHVYREIEEQVLGGLMHLGSCSHELVVKAFELLTVDCFTTPDFQRLFMLMMKEIVHGNDIDAANLSIPLLVHMPDSSELLLLDKGYCSTASLISWVEKLVEAAMIRKMLSTLTSQFQAIGELSDLSTIEDAIESLSYQCITSQRSQPNSVFTHEEIGLKAESRRNSANTFLITGFTDIDLLLKGGFRRQSMVAIGAPPSCGKTQFGLSLLWGIHSNQPDEAIICFSLEMSAASISDRLDSIILNKFPEDFTQADYDFLKHCRKTSLFFTDEKQFATVEYMRSVIRRVAHKHSVSAIMIDHLDLMGKPQNKDLRSDEKLTRIAQELHSIAKDFNCVVIVLTQLNKEAIKKTTHRPTMNDAKNSNATAEVADYWIGLKRIGQWDEGQRYQDSDLFEVIVDKNRHGQQGIVWLSCVEAAYKNVSQYECRRMVEDGNSQRRASGDKKAISF